MPQVIIFTNQSGNVSVCYPTGELPIDEVKAKDTPDGSIIVNSSELPESDNDFFDSWRLVGGSVIVDLNSAREQTKKRLRIEREPLLVAQDIAFQRALELGEDTSAIIAEKQRLRDITKLADQVNSLNEFRALKASND